MRNSLLLAVGFAAGAFAVYCMDARSGARRRAMLRDKALSAGHEAADFVQAKGKHAVDRARGVLGLGRPERRTSGPPHGDAHLHDRIRARLGHVVSHPKAVHIQVDGNRVRLTGHILANEIQRLLTEIRQIPGVAFVVNALTVHATSEGVPELQSHPVPLAAGH